MTKFSRMAQCQRIGCPVFFNEDDNQEDSCQYHVGPPVFHDGKKEWGCCKKKSHDFDLFMSIPGCTYGKHTKEKPSFQPTPKPNKPVSPPSPSENTSMVSCSRCRQGFFCSDHTKVPGVTSQASQISQTPKSLPSILKFESPPPVASPSQSRPTTQILDLNIKQICRNPGCGNGFIELENNETACQYHPGPAVFHDRVKGWKCCDIHVNDFDEFLAIPPCSTGFHNAGGGS